MRINPRDPLVIKGTAAALSSLIVLGGWMVDGQATDGATSPSVSSSASTTKTEEEMKAQQTSTPTPGPTQTPTPTPAAVAPPRVTVQDCRLSSSSLYAGAALTVDSSTASDLLITMNWGGGQTATHAVSVQAGMNKVTLNAADGEPSVREVTRCTVKAVSTAP